jgi:hypothetical protein
MIHVYRSDDDEAPTLRHTSGHLINVLDACLMDGYGDQAPAGWDKPFEGTNLAVYRAREGNRFYLRVDDSLVQYPSLRGYRTMDGLDSGTGPFPTTAQLSGGIRPVKSSTTTAIDRPWILIASPRAFYLWIGFAGTDHATLTTSTDITFFGDGVSYLPGDPSMTLLIGKDAANTTPANTRFANALATGANALGHYLANDYLQSGNALPCGVLQSMPAASASAGSAGVFYPDPLTGGLLLDRLRVSEGSSATNLVRGHLPGIFNPLHNQPGSHLDTLSGRGALAGTDLLLLYKGGTSGRLAFSMNDADWLPLE